MQPLRRLEPIRRQEHLHDDKVFGERGRRRGDVRNILRMQTVRVSDTKERVLHAVRKSVQGLVTPDLDGGRDPVGLEPAQPCWAGIGEAMLSHRL